MVQNFPDLAEQDIQACLEDAADRKHHTMIAPTRCQSEDLDSPPALAIGSRRSATAPCYAALFNPQVVSEPICCFGDSANATLVTVGVNPSNGERGFLHTDPPIPHKELARRCRECLGPENRNTHKWFEPWKESFSHLEKSSYKDGSAVHINLSPRVTRFVSDLQEAWEQELFLKMVERDLWTFFGALQLCPNAKLILMAGSVPGRY